jgi:hypothetical protein
MRVAFLSREEQRARDKDRICAQKRAGYTGHDKDSQWLNYAGYYANSAAVARADRIARLCLNSAFNPAMYAPSGYGGDLVNNLFCKQNYSRVGGVENLHLSFALTPAVYTPSGW